MHTVTQKCVKSDMFVVVYFHSGGWVIFCVFLSPENAVAFYTKGTFDKIFCWFHPGALSCKVILRFISSGGAHSFWP